MQAYRQGDVLIFGQDYVNNFLLGSQSQDGLEWLKNWLMKKFNIKDPGKAKTIIRWEIRLDLQARILKIDQKSYIRNLLEAEEISLCHSTVFPIKAG